VGGIGRAAEEPPRRVGTGCRDAKEASKPRGLYGILTAGREAAES
jgi:hypothetical protein